VLGVVLVGAALVSATAALVPLGNPGGQAPLARGPDAPQGPDPQDGSTTAGGSAGAARSIVGLEPYDGPLDAKAVFAACPGDVGSQLACYTGALEDLLRGKGSEAAFTVLEDMGRLNPGVSQQAHKVAHDLGRYAFEAYGTIEETLRTCSYKVFQGCFHGALQAYFEGVGEALGPQHVTGLCPSDNQFRQYTCLHGTGHGLFLATKHDLFRSLSLCDALSGYFAVGSCQGGAVMENVVGYFDFRAGAAHHHGPGPPEPWEAVYHVNASDYMYPCNAMQEHQKTNCWLMQTSLILYFNGVSFANATEVCDQVPSPQDINCFRSLGRDASAYANRDVAVGMRHCGHGDAEGRAYCVRGFVAESVLNYASPEAGLPVCRAFSAVDKPPCYEEMATQGRTMVGSEGMAAVCAQAEEGYESDCRRGAGLFPA
jgi:hypothetical protein